MARLVFVATDPMSADRLMDGQLAYLRSRGFEVTVITSPAPKLDAVGVREGVRTLGIFMRRDIAPLDDVVSLFRLVRALKKLRPHLVVAGTTKGGLLGTLAARLSGVPAVVYHLRGLRYETASGLKRRVLFATEHIASKCAHRIQCNGESLRQRFVEAGCAPLHKTWVPAHGTSNGVDVDRFVAGSGTREWVQSERARLGLGPGSIVVGFVGRFVRDKGIAELVAAFHASAETFPGLRLLLIGDFDETDPVEPSVVRAIRADPRIVVTGFVKEPAAYYALMDVFAFPSHREGFPNAPLEAAASGLPIVAFHATGTVDAVLDGETGTLVPARDGDALARAIAKYLRDPALRRLHGEAGRRRVRELFRREVVWSALAEEYERLAAHVMGSAESAPAGPRSSGGTVGQEPSFALSPPQGHDVC